MCVINTPEALGWGIWEASWVSVFLISQTNVPTWRVSSPLQSANDLACAPKMPTDQTAACRALVQPIRSAAWAGTHARPHAGQQSLRTEVGCKPGAAASQAVFEMEGCKFARKSHVNVRRSLGKSVWDEGPSSSEVVVVIVGKHGSGPVGALSGQSRRLWSHWAASTYELKQRAWMHSQRCTAK